MAKHGCKQICLLVVLLFVSCSWLCESRPLSPRGSSESITKVIEIFIERLHIAGIKTGGPSAGGGKGREFGIVGTLGEMKAGGPSDGGDGHGFVKAEILGGRKSGGLKSGGKGHKLVDAGTFEGQKSGGPGADRKGHEFINSKILGTHPHSGPSPGEGH